MKVPLNLFGVPFGLTGLTTAWAYASQRDLAPRALADVLALVAAVAWVAVAAAYGRSVRQRRGGLAADLADPVVGPFGALAVIVPMALIVVGIAPHALAVARVLFDVSAGLTILLGGWYTGQWIYDSIAIDQIHPGYFLPTVAGGLLAAGGAAQVGQPRLAELFLGLGGICWLILGSLILARLLTRPPLPAALIPTLAIELAPSAVATLAYTSMRGDRIDAVIAGLAGYGVLMVLAQVRLLPLFLRLSFAPGFWAFTFSWCAVVTVGLHWLAIAQPGGWKALSYVLLAAATTLVVGIGLRHSRPIVAGWRERVM
jgi:tellurite resistance protein